MGAVFRKLFVFASKDGLLIQPHGAEYHQPLHIEYKSNKFSTQGRNESAHLKQNPHLECYGIIGLVHVAAFSFLIAITQREQVAQIYGKPVYVITEVAILPLSSQSEAQQAIAAASGTRHVDDDNSDTEYSDSDHEDYQKASNDLASSPGEDEGPYLHNNRSNTSFAENVAKRKASFGKFASQWFSKQVWGNDKQRTDEHDTSSSDVLEPGQEPQKSLKQRTGSEAAEVNDESKEEVADKSTLPDTSMLSTNGSSISLLPKILRSTKLILSSRSFYFAYDFDLTRRFALQGPRVQSIAFDKLDPLYFWNRRIGSPFTDAGKHSFLVPIIQGFVGQRTFSIANEKRLNDDPGASAQTEIKEVPASSDTGASTSGERPYLLTLISRRSTKRSGLRYLRRGIDDEGNCANTAETEQILSSPDWDKASPIRSFLQIRGSIPLYFSQSPYSLKPSPVLHNSSLANETAFKKHFESLTAQYGTVQIAMLIDKHGTEVAIGNAYEKMYQELIEAKKLNNVEFEWFDFHHECRGMKFSNVSRLVDKLKGNVDQWGETIILGDTIKLKQQGIIRTNCMDCLDRTNVAESAFGQAVLQRSLEEDGYSIDLLGDESTNWFNTLWADNGDAISRQYASTAALKGDFTRTRKRNWRGQMNDLGLTLSRYYSNMFNDYFSQAVIDLLLANVSWKVFEDFESTMMSVDPGISVSSAREAAIDNCAKIVIQDADEDLIHGWTMSSPAQENTLRTMPFEETVVLLTDAAVYRCRFDWNTEKVASFEKVDLRSITKIRYGAYVTSTFTERQMDEEWNQGLVIVYTPGKGDVTRVNTRSLQNSVNPQLNTVSPVEGGTGILSWFTSKSSTKASRTLAMKIIPQSPVGSDSDAPTRSGDLPHAVAGQISDEIKRAAIGPQQIHSHPDFVEEGDIISAADAKKRIGYLEQLGHSIKKMVWV